MNRYKSVMMNLKVHPKLSIESWKSKANSPNGRVLVDGTDLRLVDQAAIERQFAGPLRPAEVQRLIVEGQLLQFSWASPVEASPAESECLEFMPHQPAFFRGKLLPEILAPFIRCVELVLCSPPGYARFGVQVHARVDQTHRPNGIRELHIALQLDQGDVVLEEALLKLPV